MAVTTCAVFVSLTFTPVFMALDSRLMCIVGGASWCWRCTLPIDKCNDYGCEYESENEDDEEFEYPAWDEMLEEGVELPQLFEQEYVREEPLVQDEHARAPSPARRLRRQTSNLDGLPAHAWQAQGLDFGAEPTNSNAEYVWCCNHDFKVLGWRAQKLEVKEDDEQTKEVAEGEKEQKTETETKKEKKGEEKQPTFYCHRCWDVCEGEHVNECQKCWLMQCLKCIRRGQLAKAT